MDEDPVVSIVIPAYNAEKFIVDTLDSIKMQSYYPTEIIVVDDASTDKTVEIAEKHLKFVEGARVIHLEKNGGVANALSIGFTAAKGEYISFVAADDKYHFCTALQRQIEMLQTTKKPWLYCSNFWYWWREKNNALTYARPHYIPHMGFLDARIVANPDTMFMALLFNNPINSSGLTVHRSTLDINWDPALKNTDPDRDLIMRYCLAGLLPAVLNLGCIDYAQHGAQLSKDLSVMKQGVELTNLRNLQRMPPDKLSRMIGDFALYFKLLYLTRGRTRYRDHIPQTLAFLDRFVQQHKRDIRYASMISWMLRRM